MTPAAQTFEPQADPMALRNRFSKMAVFDSPDFSAPKIKGGGRMRR